MLKSSLTVSGVILAVPSAAKKTQVRDHLSFWRELLQSKWKMSLLPTWAHSTLAHSPVWQVTWPWSHMQNSQAQPFHISSWYRTIPSYEQFPARGTHSSQHWPWRWTLLWPLGNRENSGWGVEHERGRRTPNTNTMCNTNPAEASSPQPQSSFLGGRAFTSLSNILNIIKLLIPSKDTLN